MHRWFCSRFGRVVLGSVLTAALCSVGSAPAVATARSVGSTSQPPAYWLAASDGGVFSFGGAPFLGSAGASGSTSPVVSITATPDGHGYWLLNAAGGLFAFGDAVNQGTAATLPSLVRPHGPLVGLVATPDGKGYWEVSANGSVYSFGDALFFGSAGALRLAKPVVAMAATPDGLGYWLTASDGGVFAFGDAVFAGSAGSIPLTKPIVGMAATPDGLGYWLVASDGGVFSYGSARFFGSTGAIRLNRPIVGVASTPDGLGYWLVASDGGIFAFGDAPFRGSTGGIVLNRPIVGIAVGLTLDPYPPGAHGYDISWPQCNQPLPSGAFAFAVLGVNDGRAFTENPCLGEEAAWAGGALTSVYMNLNAPPPGDPAAASGPAGQCAAGDGGCLAYNYGYNAAVDSYRSAAAQRLSGGVWWIDVETGNTWDANTANNARTIQGALDALGTRGAVVGIYSTFRQFPEIAGSYIPAVPIWVPQSNPSTSLNAYCTDPSLGFGGGRPWLVQYQTNDQPYDQDYPCPGA